MLSAHLCMNQFGGRFKRLIRGKYSLDNSPITLHLANGGTMPVAGETVRDLRVGGVIVEGPIVVAAIGSLQEL